MKMQVMYVDPQDDIHSIRDKMQWTRERRLLLVFPFDARVALRPIDLLLLQRHAAHLGTRLGVISHSRGIQRAATFLKVPTFRDVDTAQASAWLEMPPHPSRIRKSTRDLRALRKSLEHPESGWQRSIYTRIFFMVLAVLAIVAIFLLLMPSVVIQLPVATSPQQSTIEYTAGPSIPAVTLNGGVPSRSVVYEMETESTISITSEALVPTRYAEGTVTFTNLGLTLLGIPAGTIVRPLTDPSVRFITQQDGVLPGGTGSAIDIPVKALVPGSIGNLPPGAIALVEGTLGAGVTVTNENAMEGGGDSKAFVATDEDRSALRADLLRTMKDLLVERAGAELGSGNVIFPDTITISGELQETFTPAPGVPGEKLTLRLSGEMSIEYAAAEDLAQLRTLLLNSSLPSGFRPVSSPVITDVIVSPVTSLDGMTQWTDRVERLVRPEVDPDDVAKVAVGKRPEDAARAITGVITLDGQPTFQITPSFWPWLPLTALRINLEIVEP